MASTSQDLPPMRKSCNPAPKMVPRADGTEGPDLASSAMFSRCSADGRCTYYVTQIWDAYDCVTVRHFGTYHPKAPAIGSRRKLTREYQEILQAVAEGVDVAPIFEIFRRYHPDTAKENEVPPRYCHSCECANFAEPDANGCILHR
jgi:hypothetical protein